ncbi:hypothetical protein JCM10450v2_006334 [Rhodotorula kratochvilovae]
MSGEPAHSPSRPPSFTAADDARRWNREVIALRAEEAGTLEQEIARREHLVYASQQLAEATVRQSEDNWHREHEASLQLLHSEVMIAVGQASEPIERMRETRRHLEERVDRLSHEARNRDSARARLPMSRRRPMDVILGELQQSTHLLGNEIGRIAYQDALRNGFMTFARHLTDAMRGIATYNPPPNYEAAGLQPNPRLSIYGELQPGEEEQSPPSYRSRSSSRRNPRALPPLDDPTAEVSPSSRRGSTAPSPRRSWEQGQPASRRPSLQELASPVERQEIPADAWRRLSATSSWSDYAREVGGETSPVEAGPSEPHIPGHRGPHETHIAPGLFRSDWTIGAPSAAGRAGGESSTGRHAGDFQRGRRRSSTRPAQSPHEWFGHNDEGHV